MSTTIITTERPNVQVKGTSFAPFTDDPEEFEARLRAAGVPDGAICVKDRTLTSTLVTYHYHWWEITF